MQLEVVLSALGADVIVAGQALPSFTNRQVQTFLRLRDGESNLIAGLLRESDRKAMTGFPGIGNIPILRSLFGSTQTTVEQTDIVVLITPRIIRTHELGVDDLRPVYVGSQRNFGLTGPPPLIAPPDTPPVANPAGGAAQGQVPAPSATSSSQQPSVPPAASSKTPGVVPVTPVASAPEGPVAPAQILLTPPGTTFQMAEGVRPIPVQISGVTQLGSITLTMTYNPAVLRAEAATLGDAMKQGNVTPTFTPKIDAAAGRVDIVITRTGDAAGASVAAGVQALLASVNFAPVAPGTTAVTLSGIAMTPAGKPIALQLGSTSITVK
jgi:general secretion pathway protein D